MAVPVGCLMSSNPSALTPETGGFIAPADPAKDPNEGWCSIARLAVEALKREGALP